MMLTVERAREVLRYDRRTGRVFWRVTLSRRCVAGREAGGMGASGYWRLRIDGRYYRRGRVAWLIVHGRWPRHDLDHRDRDRANDRLRNLREATRAQNMANTPVRAGSRSGAKGVYPNKKRWSARIEISGRSRYLGTFDTIPQAAEAYQKAAVAEYGEFAHGGDATPEDDHG